MISCVTQKHISIERRQKRHPIDFYLAGFKLLAFHLMCYISHEIKHLLDHMSISLNERMNIEE